MGSGPDEAWFIAVGRDRMLVSTNGASIINGIQQQLITIIDQSNGQFGDPGSWRLQMGGWNGSNWTSQTGRWDGATARAVMVLAESMYRLVDPKAVRHGWMEYYAHRWGLSLTQLALKLWTTSLGGSSASDSALWRQLANVDGRQFGAADSYQIIVPNESILPRWNVKPSGFPSPITVRNLNVPKVPE